MRRVTGYRANRVLYNFLRSNKCKTIIVPANICGGVVRLLQWMQCTIIYCDINPATLCMDEEAVLQVVDKADAILFVHTYGVETDFAESYVKFRERNPKMAIIDDRCLCMPDAQIADSAADMVLFSTGEKKPVNLGMGGIGFVAERWKYEDLQVSENAVLTNATWDLDSKSLLTKMDAVIAHKEKLNAIYRTYLPKKIQLSEAYQHWRFNILVPNKEEIIQAIFDAGLFASGHYAPQAENCAIASNMYNHVINLFNDFYYTEEQAIRTCKIINDKLKNGI